MKDIEFHQPETISEALALLHQIPGTSLIAGGTDLVVLLKDRLANPEALVSLSRIEALRGTQRVNDRLTIGAMTPLWQLERPNPLAQAHPALREAIQSIAVPPIRNQATLGGNLCLDTKCIYYNQSQLWERRLPHCIKAGGDVCHVDPRTGICCASLAADSIGPLCAYDAQVEIASAGHSRQVPVATFLTGDGLAPHHLEPEEIVTAIHLPTHRPYHGVAYDRYSYRKALEFSQINLTATVEVDAGGGIVDAGLMVGALGPAPINVEESLAPLAGAPLTVPLTAGVSERVIAECVEKARSPRLTAHLQSVLEARLATVLRTAYDRAVASTQGD
jgi:4-hydroxybenzoyl-CoA reductase subunit beta